MRPTPRRLLALLAAAAAPALAHAQAPAPAPAAPPTSRKAVARTGLDFSPEEQKVLVSYRLTTDKLEKFEVATRKITEAVKRDPSLKAQFDNVGISSRGKSLLESIGRIETSAPAFVALLKEAGTNPRDYVLTSFSLVTAAMGSGVRKSNPDVALPPYISNENIGFFETNRTRIETDFKNYQAGRNNE